MDEIRAALDQILNSYGTSVHRDRRRFVALIRDYLPRYSGHWRYRLLILTIQAGLLDKLIAQAGALPANLLLENHTRAFSESYQILPDAARWTIETWISCFELNQPAGKRKKPAEAPQAPPKPPPKPAATPLPASIKAIPTQARTQVAAPTADQLSFRNAWGMEFVRINPGRFRMGSPPQESENNSGEIPHEVILTRTFYLQTTPVTQQQWEQVMGSNPSGFRGSDLPVEKVSWEQCQQFIATLSQQDPFRYRLPTEAEWEYAARAGTSTAYFFGPHPTRLEEYAWFDNNARHCTHPVASLKPNPWGFYDLYGNVQEWCSDWQGPYSDKPQQDPAGPATGRFRICRGGSWKTAAKGCRSAARNLKPPGIISDDLGLRLVLEI